jgi:hypothetical protein
VSEQQAGRPGASPEAMLAAVVFAVVSLLLVATLPWERGWTTAGHGAGSAASRPAGWP